MSDKREPRDGEYWVVAIRGRLPPDRTVEAEVARVVRGGQFVVTCGDDEPWDVAEYGVTFVRKVDLS